MNSHLVCPKCGAEMRSYERNGVTIDQCTGCRGVFLDRGELERLVDAESAYYGKPQERPDRDHSRRDHDDDWSNRQHGHSSGQKRKKSFLDELFD